MAEVAKVQENILRIEELAERWLTQAGVPEQNMPYIKMLSLAVAIVLIALIAAYVARRVFLSVFHRLAARTATKFDDFLIQNKAIKNLSRLIPYIIIYNSIDNIFRDFPEWYNTMKLVVDAWLVVLVLRIARSFLRAGKDFLKTKEHFRDKPIESFLQLIMIFLYIACGLVIFSILTGKSVIAFLTAMGAASAILLLVFKDTILGFVASIQVSINDMVRIGDWISMEKYGADGDVIEISLATVKVQNWDKTITTIPTYYLISDSFKNWRGMQNAGGRRIMRSLYIKISSVRHLTDEDIEELKKVQLIKEYLEKAQREITAYNDKHGVDESCLVNGRRLTNVGVFRKYIETFIQQHPDLHQDMTMMVRQLAPTTSGMAVELYAFANKTEWIVYEGIMSDIFDHLMASVPFFKLETFEVPTSGDIRSLKSQPTESTKEIKGKEEPDQKDDGRTGSQDDTKE